MPSDSHAESGEHAILAGHGHENGMMVEDIAPERSQNFLIWFIGALGWKYTLLLPASALLSFLLTAALVIAGKGKTTGAALGFIVAIPFLIGILGMIDGCIASFMVIAHSSASPKPSEWAAGMSTAMVTPLTGMTLMVPSYLLATVGLTIRALKGDPKP